MRHSKTYAPFCPSIGTRPTISYDAIVEKALRSYPGAKGDVVTALSYYAQHGDWRIENAVKHYSDYHDMEDKKRYADAWVYHYLDSIELLHYFDDLQQQLHFLDSIEQLNNKKET
jgi:hypothetical protein